MYARFGTRQVLFKKETTEGVDPTPTGLLNAFLTFEAAFEFDVDTASRTPDKPWFTADDKIETGTRAKITFMADLLGAATAGNSSPISPILQCCGMAEVLVAATSSTFNPITNAIPSATIYFYQGGQLFKCSGSRGDIEISRSPSDFGKTTFTFTGIVSDADLIDTTAIPTIDVSAFRAAPVIVPSNWLVTANGINVECVGHSVKFGNSVNYLPTSENGRVLITDRKPDCVLSILLPDLTTFNPYNLARDQTLIAISDTVDGGATLKSQISMANCKLYKPKQFKNIKGGIQLDIPYTPKPGASTGNDEIIIAFT